MRFELRAITPEGRIETLDLAFLAGVCRGLMAGLSTL